MTKGQNIFKGISKNLPETKAEDQNKPNNQQNLKPKKDQPTKPITKSLQSTITVQNTPLTTYRQQPTAEELENTKWRYLVKFHYYASKAHFIHNLKYQTLFLSYSLAEKTISLVLSEEMSYEYWVVCCLFLSMKYEEIYPPRLKDLQILVKIAIKSDLYNDCELRILEFIGLDMNFISINTMLSEFLHAVDKDQKFFIFYLLEIGLSKRDQLKKFRLKEIVLSVMFILSSHRLHLYADQVIDGTPFERIQECSKYIIITQTNANQKSEFLFKKYKNDRFKSVAYGMIPCIEGVTALLVKKTDQEEKTPKIVGLCQESNESDMVDEKDEVKVVQVIKKKNPEVKNLKPRY